MHAGANKIILLYKIDIGSKGNIMSWHIFKRLFKNVTKDELKKTIKGHIKLRTYNKTVITQLGTCTVTINFKNIKKRCGFFVVPRNGQALLGMPYTAVLKIININIDSIQAVKEECNTNIGDAGESNTTEEVPVVKKSCTNTDIHIFSSNKIDSQPVRQQQKVNWLLCLSHGHMIGKHLAVLISWLDGQPQFLYHYDNLEES